MTFLLNIGLPMIVPVLYFMVLALVPIVLLESFYIARSLAVRFSRTVGPVALGNIVSTLVGIPVTWLLLFAIQMIVGTASGHRADGFLERILLVTLYAPWLAPSPDEMYWIFPLAALFLLIPFFFATWFVEYVVGRNKLAGAIVEVRDSIETSDAERLVWRATRNSNLLSYGIIALLIVVSSIAGAIIGR
jgi:hypothetical protein